MSCETHRIARAPFLLPVHERRLPAVHSVRFRAPDVTPSHVPVLFLVLLAPGVLTVPEVLVIDTLLRSMKHSKIVSRIRTSSFFLGLSFLPFAFLFCYPTWPARSAPWWTCFIRSCEQYQQQPLQDQRPETHVTPQLHLCAILCYQNSYARQLIPYRQDAVRQTVRAVA